MNLTIPLACEWNAGGALLYAAALPGAFVRGRTREDALQKLNGEVRSYLWWRDGADPGLCACTGEILQEKRSDALQICDADSDMILDAERLPLERVRYETLKALCLRSARDFRQLYASIPEPDRVLRPVRESFYGPVPATAREMYLHTKNVNRYYFGEIGVEVSNEPEIDLCRADGFRRLEEQEGFLTAPPRVGSYDEVWSLAKVLRRFLWHDRIHAKALWRHARAVYGPELENPFCFPEEASQQPYGQ